MKQQISLRTKVEVEAFDVSASVAFGRELPEFLAMAELASCLGRPITGSDVRRELLKGLPELMGWRAIQRCVQLGILNQPGHRTPAFLTPRGRRALEHGEVLVPKKGSFRFWLADHPLLRWPVLSITRLIQSKTYEADVELIHREKEAHKKISRGDATPQLLLDCLDSNGPGTEGNENSAEVIELVGGGGKCTLVNVSRKGMFPKMKLGLTLDLTWSEGGSPRIVLGGNLDGNQINADLRLPRLMTDSEFEEAWCALVGQALGHSQHEVEEWPVRDGELCVPSSFDEISDECRRSFRTTLDLQEPWLEGMGTFESTRIANVSLTPATQADADDWGQWLQRDRIIAWQTLDSLEGIESEVRSLFAHHEVELDEPSELIVKAAKNVPRSRADWFLLAPSDLGLHI